MSQDEHGEPTAGSEPAIVVGEIEAFDDDDIAGPIAIEPVPDPLEEVPTNELPMPAVEPATPKPPITRPPPTPTPWKSRSRTPEPGVPSYVTRSPTASLVQMMRPNAAVILLGTTFLLAVIEIIAAFLAYREQIEPEDWDEVEALLEASEAESVLVASEWLAPRARMELPQARGWDSVAPPDLRGMARFWVLSFGRHPWTPELRAELEDMPMPDLLAIHMIGDLMLAEYQQDMAGEQQWSLLDDELEITSDAGRCGGKHGRWNCKDGRAQVRVMEVDYRPRRCLALALDDGVTARIDVGEVELGNRLRGHVGFGDFNARLRADPTVVLEAWIDRRLAARWLFTDDQGWAAFALATEPGPHDLELRVSSTLAGTWQREGHRSLPTDTVCLEARAFVEPEPPVVEVEP